MDVPRLHDEFLFRKAGLPFGVTTDQIAAAVNDFYLMFHDINKYTVERDYGRLEKLMREATFSDFVGESLTRALAKSCLSLKRNLWNNGYPDLLSRADNAEAGVPRGIGIEVKASRASGQWQAHNREAGWFLVFRFLVDTQTEDNAQALPFQIVEILAAELTLYDWSVSRGAEGDITADANSGDSLPSTIQQATQETPIEAQVADIAAAVAQEKRRTRTTSTNASGTYKLRSNPVYADPVYVVKHKNNPLWLRLKAQAKSAGDRPR
ncbi:MAG TPA: hypothetical protein VFB21_13510 [Chthonomonadaceae bacterium]|nr:hypothetical protein [Chthonomonadaceae bacterium]